MILNKISIDFSIKTRSKFCKFVKKNIFKIPFNSIITVPSLSYMLFAVQKQVV